MNAGRLMLRADAVDWLEIEGEVVAIERETSTYLAANASGAVVWQALADGTTRDELISLLTDRYGIAQDEATVDVDRFLDELLARGLLIT